MSENPPPTSTRLLKSAFGLLLVIPGLAFVVLLWNSYLRAEETRHWTPTPCLITFSDLLTEHVTPNSPITYRAGIRYRYTFGGAIHESSHIARVDGPSSDRAKTVALCEKYPPGRETTCFVNPAKPDFAVLEHATRAALYSIWFPCLFVVGGAGMMISAWRKK
ncbi:MAG: DUF3592 domain-containing protein [Verrucomicrobiaceae bacterium]